MEKFQTLRSSCATVLSLFSNKLCASCGLWVPLWASPGHCCPHCGRVWHHVNPTGLPDRVVFERDWLKEDAPHVALVVPLIMTMGLPALFHFVVSGWQNMFGWYQLREFLLSGKYRLQTLKYRLQAFLLNRRLRSGSEPRVLKALEEVPAMWLDHRDPVVLTTLIELLKEGSGNVRLKTSHTLKNLEFDGSIIEALVKIGGDRAWATLEYIQKTAEGKLLVIGCLARVEAITKILVRNKDQRAIDLIKEALISFPEQDFYGSGGENDFRVSLLMSVGAERLLEALENILRHHLRELSIEKLKELQQFNYVDISARDHDSRGDQGTYVTEVKKRIDVSRVAKLAKAELLRRRKATT